MGKTQKPLTLGITEALRDWPEITQLRAQGHSIVEVPTAGIDVLFGPSCWRLDESLRKYLALAIHEARTLKYPNKETTK